MGHAGAPWRPASARRSWISRDLVEDAVEGGGHALVHGHRVLAVEPALDQHRPVAVAGEERQQLVGRDPGQHGRVRRSCTRSGGGSGSTAPSRRGSRNLFECHPVAAGPVSASPSPTTQATTRSGLSKAAPNAWLSE